MKKTLLVILCSLSASFAAPVAADPAFVSVYGEGDVLLRVANPGGNTFHWLPKFHPPPSRLWDRRSTLIARPASFRPPVVEPSTLATRPPRVLRTFSRPGWLFPMTRRSQLRRKGAR